MRALIGSLDHVNPRLLRWCACVIIVLGLGLKAHAASGLLMGPESLSATTRTLLAAQISKAKTADPNTFAAVRASIDQVASGATTRGGDPPSVSLEVYGTAVVLPIIELLAFDAPAQGTISNEAWKVWKLSLLESLGRLRASSAAPVLIVALDVQSDTEVLSATAEALGLIRTKEAVAKLIAVTKVAGSKRVAILAGMRTCRKLTAAQALGTILAGKPAASTALPSVRSLGSIGNAYAWQVPGMPAAEGEQTRSAATKALVTAFVNYTGGVREAARIAMMVVGHPSLRTQLTAARAAADTTTKADIDKLLALPVSIWMPKAP